MRPLWGALLALGVLAVLSEAPQVALGQTSQSLAPDHDAFVSKGEADQAHDSTELRVRSHPPAVERSYLHFDLSSIPAGSQIQQAQLKLHLETAPSQSRTYGLYKVTENGWQEATLTWNNAPDKGASTPETTFSIAPSSTSLDIDLSDLVKAWHQGTVSNFGIFIRDEDETGNVTSVFHSGVAATQASRPSLEVTYLPPTPTPTATATFTATATPTASATATVTPTASATATVTPMASATATVTPTATLASTMTPTPTPSQPVSATPTPQPAAPPVPTPTPQPAAPPPPTPTPTAAPPPEEAGVERAPTPEPAPVQPFPLVHVARPGEWLVQLARRFYGDAGLWTLIWRANLDIIPRPGLLRPGMRLVIPPPPEGGIRSPAGHVVQRGDTLFQLARRFYGDAGRWVLIWRANRDVIARPSLLRPGTTLVIPAEPQASPRPAPTPEVAGLSRQLVYVVQPGDWLVQLARRFYGDASLWELIWQANRDVMPRPDLLRPGLRLMIPPP